MELQAVLRLFFRRHEANRASRRPEIQKFAGALHGQHATKGIFITTSDFSRDANDYVSKIGSKIVLIDGSRLAELMIVMIEFGVAVATETTYTVKRIDNDFFETI
jgi:restriction system protein